MWCSYVHQNFPTTLIRQYLLKKNFNKLLFITRSRKTKALLYLKNHKLYTDKIYLYVKDPYEAKYQLLINKDKGAGLKHCNDSQAFIEYSNDMVDIYENLEENNLNRKCKILIVFDDMIADVLSHSLIFPFQKNIRLNSILL